MLRGCGVCFGGSLLKVRISFCPVESNICRHQLRGRSLRSESTPAGELARGQTQGLHLNRTTPPPSPNSATGRNGIIGEMGAAMECTRGNTVGAAVGECPPRAPVRRKATALLKNTRIRGSRYTNAPPGQLSEAGNRHLDRGGSCEKGQARTLQNGETYAEYEQEQKGFSSHSQSSGLHRDKVAPPACHSSEVW